VSTGNELVQPGGQLGPGQIFDINGATLPGIVRAHGGEPIRLSSARDSLDELRASLARAADADVVLFSGGSSVGERDLLVDVVRERGEVVFHGIAVKPGKPTLFARCGSALVFGMPGNPTSCLSNAYILLVPLLRRLAHLPPWRPERRLARLASAVSSSVDRHQFYPVRLDGARAVPVFKGSGEITSLSQADGYFEIPIGVGGLAEGTAVEVTLF
jgi:molybdenum cofactor synthesis domain-containing protein